MARLPKKILQWVRALESGDYEQTKRRLYRKGFNGPCFCCLGVYDKVVLDNKVEHWVGSTRITPNTHDAPVHVYNAIEKSLGRNGLDVEMQDDLIRLNDTDHSFAYIASKIRDHYKSKPTKSMKENVNHV